MRVLLVDDEEHVLRAMARVFRRQPRFSLVGVRSVEEALHELDSGAFAAAIVDHHLIGDTTGAALLRIIAQRWPQVRRILCSGGAMNGDDELGGVCADVVLMKPATVDELVGAIDGLPSHDAIAREGGTI